jgi:hypothetical protein
MTAEEYQQWEALALNRNRYSSDEEYRLNVIRWIRHMEPMCEQILRQLENPLLEKQHEHLRACLNNHIVWQEHIVTQYRDIFYKSSEPSLIPEEERSVLLETYVHHFESFGSIH